MLDGGRILEKRFDDDWFIGYRHHLLRTSSSTLQDRRPHILHDIMQGVRLGGSLDGFIDRELRRLPPRHAGAVRAHMHFYRACLLSTGLVPADALVSAAVQIEWFWYNTAFSAFYRDHLAHVMKVAAIGLSLLQDLDSPFADGPRPLIDIVAGGMASGSLGSATLRAAARRCGNSASMLQSPEFWKAVVLESVRLAGLLHDMAHPAVIASRMSRIAAPVRPRAPFELTEKEVCSHTVAAFAHRLLAAPFNRGDLPDTTGLTPEDAEACAEVFQQSHSLRAGYAIVRLAEEANRVWQLSPFDAFVMEWTALAVSLHDYYRLHAVKTSQRPEDEMLARWLQRDERNFHAVRACFKDDPVSYILALSDQLQDFGRVLGPTDTDAFETDKMEMTVRYPCKAVTFRVDRQLNEAQLILDLAGDDGTCFGATSTDQKRIQKHKQADAALIFGGPSGGSGGWLNHEGLLSGVAVEIRREEAKRPPGAAISRGELRHVIQEVMVTDSDLSAFFIDYFPEINQYMTKGMDRVEKLNVLLERVKPETIWAHLVTAHPQVASLRR